MLVSNTKALKQCHWENWAFQLVREQIAQFQLLFGMAYWSIRTAPPSTSLMWPPSFFVLAGVVPKPHHYMASGYIADPFCWMWT